MEKIDLFSNDLVQREMKRAVEFGQRAWSEHYMQSMETELSFQQFESPLEAAFFVWWRMLGQTLGIEPALTLQHQHTAVVNDRTYRLDFAVLPGPPRKHLLDDAEALAIPVPQIGVELDGHDFHERTKEQVAHRNRRDRDLLSAGWLIFHYSGSEFLKDEFVCVQEVFTAALGKFVALREEIIDRKKKMEGPHGE